MMKLSKIAIMMLCGAVGLAMGAIASSEETRDRATLETKVAAILQEDNISQRPEIDAVFALADLDAKEGLDAEAIRLYGAGLQVDSGRLEYQLRLARLLLKTDHQEDASDKAKLVYQYAEEPDLVEQAKGLLTQMGQQPSPAVSPSSVTSDAEIVLVPMGGIRRQLLEEVMPELEDAVGVHYRIASFDLPLGAVDRTLAAQYLAGLMDNVGASYPPPQLQQFMQEAHLSTQDIQTPAGQQRLIEHVIQKTGQSAQLLAFRAALHQVEGQGQYQADRLVETLKTEYPLIPRTTTQGYLGVTEADLYNGHNNFLFGWAQAGYGVMSYHRFLASINDETPNRERLRRRFVKQAVSSSFFILGIPRCTSPVCIRAYPNRLTEHDDKGSELCAWCQKQLRAKLTQLHTKPAL